MPTESHAVYPEHPMPGWILGGVRLTHSTHYSVLTMYTATYIAMDHLMYLCEVLTSQHVFSRILTAY